MLLKPKKYLGQNFLFDKNIQKKIADACEISHTDVVLEIGAGYGTLTAFLAQRAAKVYALEIDKNLSEALKDTFKNSSNIEILNQDILKFDFKIIPGAKKIKVIGNIPYYITTPIIEHLFQYPQRISGIYLLVQKEFAKRIAALAGRKEYGSFSCFVQYHSNPKIFFTVKKTAFTPRPKVDSCFLKLEVRKEPPVKARDKELLFRIIRSAFNQRRKTLRNSLKNILTAKALDDFFVKYDVDRNIRPEDLSLQDYAHLAMLIR